MLVYKVKAYNSGCEYIAKKIDDAIEVIADNLQDDLSYKPMAGDASKQYHIEVEEMTEEEFNDLPKFDGF